MTPARRLQRAPMVGNEVPMSAAMSASAPFGVLFECIERLRRILFIAFDPWIAIQL